MLTAMLAVENTLGAEHDLWKVNEEQEYHEEIREEPSKELTQERLFASAFARMDKLGFATALGSVCGVLVFLATIWLIIQGGEVAGPNLQLLAQYFYGYRLTVKGAFLGMVYSFSWGFLFGWLFAYFRNLFLGFYVYRVKRRLEMLTFRDFLDHF